MFKDTPRGIWYILISTSALRCVTGTEGSGKIRRHMSVYSQLKSGFTEQGKLVQAAAEEVPGVSMEKKTL